MALATSTAIALGSAAIAGGTSASSFIQAGHQRKLQQQAQADAAKALEEARKRTEINTYAALGIQKEPYALEREALLTQGAQSLQAAQEGDTRGVAATAGRVQAQQNQAQAQITSAMGQEMSNLDKLKAQEESRLRDVNIQLDLGQVAGSQQAAADAASKAAAATQAGFTQASSALQQGIAAGVPLFSKQPIDTGIPNTSLQASAKMAGLGGSYTPPQFNTNTAWANGINPFQVAPSINYNPMPSGFNQQPTMPFGGGNPLPTYVAPQYQFPKFP